MNTRIRRIEYQLPEREVTNQEFQKTHPEWDMNAVAERAGVEVRYFSAPDETALDLAEKACLKVFENDPEALENVGALIFCTQTPDHTLPSNACLLHGRLGMKEAVLAFDVAMGCSGFVNALSLAHGFIQSRQADSVLVVTGDTLSKRVSDDDRSIAVLFGDGAAATLVEKSNEEGLIDVESATAGKYWEFLHRFKSCSSGTSQPSMMWTSSSFIKPARLCLTHWWRVWESSLRSTSTT